MSVSIIIPCYNEEAVIEKVVRTYHDDIVSKIDNSELIVIDDCSKDNTYEILKALESELPGLKVLRPAANGGHGPAVRFGYDSAACDHVFQVDSDDQFEAADFWKLYELRDKYDFILGFRKVRNDPLPRLLLTKVVRVMNLLCFGLWIKDANCPFRLIKKELLQDILSSVDKEALAPNIMISVLAMKRARSIEIPVTHYERTTGTVSIKKWKLIKFSLRGLKQLLDLRSARRS